MRNKLLVMAFFAIGFGTAASAQSSASATVKATADIVTPISIIAGDNMNFGKIVASPAGGTVNVSTAGELSASGVTVHSSSVGSAASFDVSGEPNFTYDITLPSTFDLTGPTGSTAMTVSDFASDATKTLSENGTETFHVSAKLTVGVSQAPGTYTNETDFTVTVAYN